MLASLSQFIRDTGNSIKLLPDQDEQHHHQQQSRDKTSSPETDIASATTSVIDADDVGEGGRQVKDAAARAAERRRRKSAMVYETFIVVRPPPSVSNHPLNLQLQLVPPSTREQARQASGSSGPSVRPGQSTETVDQQQNAANNSNPPNPITARTGSMRSNRSATSLYSSASLNSTTFSFSSTTSNTTTSTSTGPSHHRRIIPLYNLSAHNVMTNTITDAGTDAKVAKFGKRGIEVIGLGVLECYEVFGIVLLDPSLSLSPATVDPNRPQQSQLQFLSVNSPHLKDQQDRLSERSVGTAPPSVSEHTPSSSNNSQVQLGGDAMATPTASHHVPQSQAASQSNQPSTPTPSSAKKIFGKMFKRREVGAGGTTTPTATPSTPRPANPLSPSSTTTPTPSTPTPSTAAMSPSTSIFQRSKRAATNNIPHEPTIPENPMNTTNSIEALNAAGTLQPPCLGTQATLLHRTMSDREAERRGAIVPNGLIQALSTNAAAARASLQLHKSRSRGSMSNGAGVSERPTTGEDYLLVENALHPVVSPSFSIASSSKAPTSAAGSPPIPGGGGGGPPPVLAAGGFRKTSHSYEWVIRRWIKGNDGGLFGIKEGLLSAKSAVFSPGITSSFPGGSSSDTEVEVRFEWVKGKGSVARTRERTAARNRSTVLEEDEDADDAGPSTNASSPRGSRRSAAGSERRPRSMITVGSETDPFGATTTVAVGPAGRTGRDSRPTSMVNPGVASMGLDPSATTTGGVARVPSTKRQSLQPPGPSKTPSPRKVGGAMTSDRSPSPVRQSMDSSSRRSSDESESPGSGGAGAGATLGAELVSGGIPMSAAETTAKGSVYKGKMPRDKRRTASVTVRDRELTDMDGDGADGGAGGAVGDVEDPESDPEDSETPWTCTLYVGPPVSREVLPDPSSSQDGASAEDGKKKGHGRSGSISGSKSAFVLGSAPMSSNATAATTTTTGHQRYATSASAHLLTSSSSSGTFGGGHRKVATDVSSDRLSRQATLPREEPPRGLKIKLGTLTPAPYHPKVVSQLRMPFPLPDVNVKRMEAVKPGDHSQDKAGRGGGSGGDLILTMEEIKDVVCVTGLWLVVREGFGGLERRRKGDGWKIRG